MLGFVLAPSRRFKIIIFVLTGGDERITRRTICVQVQRWGGQKKVMSKRHVGICDAS